MSLAATPEPLNHQIAVVVRARLITALLDTATLILMVRLVGGKDEFGVLQIFLVGYELARYVATFGFPDSVYFFFAKLHDSQRRAFAIRTFQILTAGGALVALGMLVASLSVHLWLPGWSPAAQATVSEGLPWLALVAAIELPTWAIYPLLVASDQGRIAGRFEVVTSSLAMIALVLPLVLGLGVMGVLGGLVIYAVLRATLSLWLMRKYLPTGTGSLEPGFLRRQCAYAIPLGLHTIAGRLNKYADKLIVGILLTEAFLAEYGVASTELPFITVFPYAVGSVLIARYVRRLDAGGSSAALSLWNKAASRVALLVIPCGFFAVITAPDIVVWVAGEEYRAAALPFALVATLLIHRVAQYGGMLQALDQTDTILKITLSTLALNVAISIPLTIEFGIVGTACGTVLAQWFAWFLYVRAISKHLQRPVRAVLPWATLGRILIPCLLAGAASLCVRHLLLTGADAAIGASVSALVFFGTYLAFGQLLGVFSKAAWGSLRMIALGVPKPTPPKEGS